MKEFNDFWKVLESVTNSSAIGNSGRIIPIVDVWEFLSIELAKLAKTSIDDTTLYALQGLMNSPLPQTALILPKVLENEITEVGIREATKKDVYDFVRPTASEDEWEFAMKIISEGGVNGYSVENSSLYKSPKIIKSPEKKIKAIPHPEWMKSAGTTFPFSISLARFVLSDSSFLFSSEFTNLIELQKRIKTPIVLMCWKIDEKIASWFGKAWKNDEFWIIPCEIESIQEDSLFRNNLLADTAWIVGSSLSSYVNKEKIEFINEKSSILSGDFSHLKFGFHGCKFPAISTSKFCDTRARQLLALANGQDEISDNYRKRAAYIQGISIQGYLPLETKIRLSSIDLIVSAYKEFMYNGASELPDGWNLPWKSVPSNYIASCVSSSRTIRKFKDVLDYEA